MNSRAEELMSQALSDPRAALESGEILLNEMVEKAYHERSEVLRAMSMAARHLNEFDTSIELASRAAEAAEAGGNAELRFMGLLTLSGSLAVAGRTNESLEVIDGVRDQVTDPGLRARYDVQRGGVLQNAGRELEAKAAFLSALPLFREVEDELALHLTLNRLGRAYVALGQLSEAEICLEESLELAQEHGELAAAHGIMHNLGLLASYRGDIPDALEWLEKSDELYMEITGSDAPQHVARAEVLISVGLFEEALDSAALIARSAGSRSDLEHQGNALLVASRAALMAGRYHQAVEHADAAVAIFDRVDMPYRRAEARAIAVEAKFIDDGVSSELLHEAEQVVDLMAREELMVATAQARFLCARIADELGDRKRARRHLREVAEATSGPVEVRLQVAVARSRLAMIDGHAGNTLRAARRGLRLIDHYQATLGATDLRMGIEKHGTDLAETGLRLALESGRPRRVLEWLDRTRARSLRYQPVVPTGDDQVSAALADLRRIEAELRRPENRDARDLHRRRRRLQREIAAADRVRRETRMAGERFSIDALVDSLGDRTLVEIGALDGQLLAVVVRRGRARLVGLGAVDPVINEVRHLRFGMRRAARSGRPVELQSIDRLEGMLFGDLRFGDDVVVIVPPASLMAAPWAVLPRLRGRSLTISPSAEMWWRGQAALPSGESVLVAGGPDLVVAGPEVKSIGSLYPKAVVLPPGSGVDDVRAGMVGARIAHIASHASFQVENPMFSSLRLGDGDLNVYDIERLERSPDLVVLSACDSGYTETRAGDELAGLTSALVSMGTRSVVASVGLVPDSPATSDLMVRFHRLLIGGMSPSQALSAAQEEGFDDPETFVAAASFICVGA